MPPAFHRFVRPALDGLSLLVFLFALASATWHVVMRPGCLGPSKQSETRWAIDAAAHRLQVAELERPGAIEAALTGPFPAHRLATLAHMRRPHELLDGWDRPLVFTALPGDWLIEVRSRGYDAVLHTDDDEYARIDRQGWTWSRERLEDPPEVLVDTPVRRVRASQPASPRLCRDAISAADSPTPLAALPPCPRG